MTIRELAEQVIRQTDSTSKIEYLPPLAEGDMSRRCPDVSKMRSILGRPVVPLDEGIRRLVAYFKALPR
jgi:UDP-glucuronate decarboxylase